MCSVHGDHNNRLPKDFGKMHPEIVEKYFSSIDDLPDVIQSELGIKKTNKNKFEICKDDVGDMNDLHDVILRATYANYTTICNPLLHKG